jgi:hypothetical protein
MTPVSAPVVGDDDLPADFQLGEARQSLLDADTEGLRFVQTWHHDRDLDPVAGARLVAHSQMRAGRSDRRPGIPIVDAALIPVIMPARRAVSSRGYLDPATSTSAEWTAGEAARMLPLM